MTLPPRALNVLASIKKEMLAQSAVSDQPSASTAEAESRKLKAENSHVMRRARTRGGAFQRMCQRRDWASPV